MLTEEQKNNCEEDLLLSFIDGDRDALSILYNLHVQQLYFFVLKMAKSPELAEDVLQDVFIKLWENRSLIDPTRPLKPYLYTIARRHLLNLLKRASHESVIVDEIKKYTPLSEKVTDLQTEYNESKSILNEAIEQLAPRSREVFVRCKIDGLSYKQVAEEMGITEGTVNNQMVKATKSIKRYFSVRDLLLFAVLFYR